MNPDNQAPVIAVDGPSGVGKGTLCRFLAIRLGWHLLDSGSLYRLTALAALQRRIPLDREIRIAPIAAGLDARFVAGNADEDMEILLGGVDVTQAIRDEACGNAASKVAAMPRVRAALLERQRHFRQPPGLVADGRDMGSVVFTDARIKIFLTASPEERAIRRYNQLKQKGIDASLSQLIIAIAERDERDAKRQVSPLRAAEDAFILDTTRLNITEVQQRVLEIIHNRL